MTPQTPDPTIAHLLDAVPDPMVFISPSGVIDIANPPAVALLGGWIAGRNYITVLRQPLLLARIERALLDGRREPAVSCRPIRPGRQCSG